jgi:hypothetical protein
MLVFSVLNEAVSYIDMFEVEINWAYKAATKLN